MSSKLVIDLTTGQAAPVTLSAPEQTSFDNAITAHINNKLNKYKKLCVDANRTEAGVRISALFSAPNASPRLFSKEINKLANVVSNLYALVLLVEKVARGTATGGDETNIAALETALNNLDSGLLSDINAIRTAENDAAALILAASDIAGVDAVKTPSWP